MSAKERAKAHMDAYPETFGEVKSRHNELVPFAKMTQHLVEKSKPICTHGGTYNNCTHCMGWCVPECDCRVKEV